MNSDTTNQIVSWAIGAPSIGVVIAYGISMIRRKVSSDSKALQEDKSYNSMIETYKSERDELRAERDRLINRIQIVEAERSEAVGKVGKLTAEVEFLSLQVTELKSLVEKLGTTLELSRVEIHNLAVGNAKLAAHVTYLDEIVDHKRRLSSGASE